MHGSIIHLNEYSSFLNSIKSRIQQARINASRVVNRELTLLYQHIGQQIVDEEISKLSVTAWQEAYKDIFENAYLSALNWEPRVKGRRDFFTDSRKTSFVAIIDGKIVGFCDAGPARIENAASNLNASYGEIYAIYVLQQYQKLSIGKMLYEQAIKHLQEIGLSSFVVWTLVKNKAAIEFYIKQGCTATPWHKSFEAAGQIYDEIALIHKF